MACNIAIYDLVDLHTKKGGCKKRQQTWWWSRLELSIPSLSLSLSLLSHPTTQYLSHNNKDNTKMVPNNKSPPNPHVSSPPPSSSSSAQFQLSLFTPLMPGTSSNPDHFPQPPPNPTSDFLYFSIVNPNPTFSDDRTQIRDLEVVPNINLEPLYTEETSLVPHCLHQQQQQQQQQTPLDLLPSEFVFSDQDTDIDKIIAPFIDNSDNPSNELPDGLPASSSNGGGDDRGQGFLKRGPVDFLGFSLSIDGNNATPKRTKTTATGGLDNLNLNLGFGFPSGSVLFHDQDQGDQRGKRKLDDHGGTDNNAIHEIVTVEDDDENEDATEIDFLSDAFDESGFRAPKPDNSNLDNDYLAYPRQGAGSRRRERFRDIAKENASRFARFQLHPDAKDNKDDGASSSSPEAQVEPPIDEGPTPPIDEGPTPFSTAMKSMKDKGVKNVQTKTWVPKRNEQGMMGARVSVPPSLKELCLKILARNADAIESLDGVPDDLRQRLSQLLCDSRRMNTHSFELLVSGSPTVIHLRDCSWLSEEQFSKSFKACDTANLEVLQLDQCGRCMPDYILEQPPRWLRLPRLTTLSLTGACRLSDKGLHVLVSSAPSVRSINLSQCSLLTSASIGILADSLGSLLKELYLDDCHNIDAAKVLPALKKLEHIEVLSLSGIQNVCDKFIKDYIIARGQNMKELGLKDCIKVTDVSMKIIAEHCPGLCVIDLMNLCKLTDLSLGYLANSCQALHTLKLRRSPFSDEAIAAFIEITGESLKELSLNNINKVGHHTTSSLATHAKNLHTLDLSWCRNLTDDELGMIVDSCFSLRFLKLFGCSQVTDVFLNGYSNPGIQIVGLKMSPLLKHVKVPDPYQGALRYSPVSVN